MENEERKSKLKTTISLLMAILIIALVGVGIATYPKWWEQAKNMFSDKEQVVQPTEESSVEPQVFTIEDIVNMREQEREYRYLDSMYMDMPKVALIAILIKNGVDMSHTDIAKEYLQNKKSYNDVEFGAQINDIYKQSINQEPDTIPKQAKTDTPSSARE